MVRESPSKNERKLIRVRGSQVSKSRPGPPAEWLNSSPQHEHKKNKSADQEKPEDAPFDKWETAARKEFLKRLVDIVTSPSPPQESVRWQLSFAETNSHNDIAAYTEERQNHKK